MRVHSVGIVKGVGEATTDNPHANFFGTACCTDGNRNVIFPSETPVALSRTQVLFGREYVGDRNREVFKGEQAPPPNDRLHVHTEGHLTVSTAVPSAEETEAIFGYDLYRKNIQPDWVQVENRGEVTLFLTPAGLAYYSPRKSAARSRTGDPPELSSARLERTGFSRLHIAPRSVRSGYVFSTVDAGAKSFNVDILGSGIPCMTSFFVPVPGRKFDHYGVDIQGMCPESGIKHVDLPQLVAGLERMPRCVRDGKGEDRGDPLNLVLIDDAKDLFSRDIGVHFTWRTITTHKIDPNVDETREFLLEDLAYTQALDKFGHVGGVGPAR